MRVQAIIEAFMSIEGKHALKTFETAYTEL